MSLKSPYKPGGMFEGASNIIFENARNLRENMTAAEMNLWMHLREGINGFKFRRQHPIFLFIADFYCHKVKLIVEIDGYFHNDKIVQEGDRLRTVELEKMGYTIIRFTNKEVLQNVDSVIQKITCIVSSLMKQ